MTIIVFLIDNSASMNQRTIQGTTLLDVAKTATELFFKVRMSKSRVDRYFVLTLDSETNYVKLAGWKQNVDLQCLHIALNNIKADGCTTLSEGLQRTFRMLNLNRLQLGLENYGMGLFPSLIEPAVIVCITDGCNNSKLEESILQDTSLSSIETSVFGQCLTNQPFRWDYRLYSLVLRYPAFVQNTSINPNSMLTSNLTPPILKTAELTGGKGFCISDHRELQQCLESLTSKCQPAVVMEFEELNAIEINKLSTEKVTPVSHKQLVYVKLMGRVCSSWPIPEQFWPDEELLSTQLPSRPAHPKLYISPMQVLPPVMPEYFPVDRYELEPSALTQRLCSQDSQMVWQCFSIDDKRGHSAPFGYLKSSSDQTVHLHVLPYNYPVFAQLLNELYEVHHMRMSESWGHQFVNYLSNIPRYYFLPLTKAFEKFGFQGVIKPEAIDRVLPYQMKHSLQKLRHAAKIEYDNFVRISQNEEVPVLLRLPSSLLPGPLWSLREFRPKAEKPLLRAFQPYIRTSEVNRRNLRRVLRRMRQNLDDVLNGKNGIRMDLFIHQQPVAQMGDYINYRAFHITDTPLREVNPAPERLDTFGNPFRKKAPSSFVADEVFVDEMTLPNGLPGGANATMVNPNKKKQHASGSGSVIRTKGPLPAYINHLNWRQSSPKHSPPCSPNSSCGNQDDMYSPMLLNSAESFRGLNNIPSIDPKPVAKNLSAKDAFDMNSEVVRDLTNLIRQSCAGDLLRFITLFFVKLLEY
ncbi:unnamed protein product [Calicophoron daubneyi]|uniref:VWFA domain-containing protein n=1 Tax=Calicophoron daubneyi TaxID=300641 RepID=A0AAV2TB69_CALDB